MKSELENWRLTYCVMQMINELKKCDVFFWKISFSFLISTHFENLFFWSFLKSGEYFVMKSKHQAFAMRKKNPLFLNKLSATKHVFSVIIEIFTFIRINMCSLSKMFVFSKYSEWNFKMSQPADKEKNFSELACQRLSI